MQAHRRFPLSVPSIVPGSSRHRRHAQGFSLLEILLVLGIAAAIIIAAFVVYPKVQASNRAQTEAQNITTIAAGARSLYASTSNYASITNTVLLNGSVFPDSMVAADKTTVTNVWGGTVTIVPSTNVTNGFSIQEAGVPQIECTRIAASAGANFTYVSIGGAAIKTPTLAFSVPTVTSACLAGGANNTMTFEGL